MLMLLRVVDDVYYVYDTTVWEVIGLSLDDCIINRVGGVGFKTNGAIWVYPLNKCNFNFKTSNIDSFGSIKTMNNGLRAMLIGYRNNSDIDVLFENGFIAYSRSYRSFNDCKITVPGWYIHYNEERIMNNGAKAVIIDYRTNRDIDVKFEDGLIKTCTYENFCKGNVLNQNCNKHINETRVMYNGMSATIIKWISSDDIVVKFEDNYIKRTTYQSFLSGKVSNKNIPKLRSLPEKLVAYNLMLNNIRYASSYKPDWLKLSSNYQAEIDLYFSYNNTQYAIEYDGALHSNKRDYLRDLEKTDLIKDNGIVLIRLREIECSYNSMLKKSYFNKWFDCMCFSATSCISLTNGKGSEQINDFLYKLFKFINLPNFKIDTSDNAIDICKNNNFDKDWRI